MKSKTILTAVLLLFVAASVVYLVVKESRRPTTTAQGADKSKAVMPHKVTVYYFHGTVRCARCRKFEAYADEALKAGFPEELQSGKLEWRIVNVDDPENGHFIADYGLTTRSLVIADMNEGQQVKWKNLEKIWDLVGDKDAFLAYVTDETQAYLRESN